jgi:hypothetical protein
LNENFGGESFYINILLAQQILALLLYRCKNAINLSGRLRQQKLNTFGAVGYNANIFLMLSATTQKNL